MWEAAAALLAGLAGAVFTAVAMSWKDGHFKGKQAKTIDTIEKAIEELKQIALRIPAMESGLQQHQERLDSQTRDHQHLENAMSDLSSNIHENSVVTAALKATLEGLQGMIQNIISGNLTMRQ